MAPYGVSLTTVAWHVRQAGADVALEDAERQLDEALEQIMQAEIGGEGDDDEDGQDGSDDGDGDGDDDDDSTTRGKKATGGVGGGSGASIPSTDADNGLKRPTPTPVNFSRVDLLASPETIAEQFPQFSQEARGLTVTLNAGEMLFLPAGWFHEVRSGSSPADGFHMAFNYWFHPPDGDAHDAPYTSPFWAWDWQQRMTTQDDDGGDDDGDDDDDVSSGEGSGEGGQEDGEGEDGDDRESGDDNREKEDDDRAEAYDDSDEGAP